MLVLLITDQHIGARNDNQAILDNQTKFYEKVFFPTIDELGIKHIIDLGDTFDKRKQVNISTLNTARKVYFDPLKERGVHSDILIGNHTAYYRNSNKINTIDKVLDSYFDCIDVVSDHPVVKNYDGLDIMLMPWINQENLDSCLSAIKNPKADILMAHLEIEGFTMQRGTVCKHGMKASSFKRFDKVYTGHFHSPSTQGNIQYLGSPYETTWADYGDVKGFHILDTDTRQLKMIINPYGLHKKIDFEDMDNIKADDVEGAIVRLVVNHPTKKTQIDEAVDFLTKSRVVEVKVVDLSALKPTTSGKVLDVESLSSTEKMISDYVDEMDDSKPKTDIKSFLNELHKEALSL